MAEDKSRKTEQPTAHRLRELRDKGQVSQSRDLLITVNLVVLFLYFWGMWDTFMALFIGLMEHTRLVVFNDFDTALAALYDHALRLLVMILVPIAGVSLVSIAVASIVQNGFIFSVDPVIPRLEKVNPAQGIKRVFSQKSLVEAVKSLLKILLLGLVLVLVVWALLGDILETPACGLVCVRELTFRASIIIFILGALVFVVESLFDLWYQKQQFIRDNMMSKDEVKRDQKNTEGDPLLKGERQSRARELTETDLKQAIADATLAIRSGDRVILLEYEAGRTPLPFILLKERGESATQVLAAARRRELPIEEDHALGRRLWREGRVNQYIPRSTIEDLGKLFARRGTTTGKG